MLLPAGAQAAWREASSPHFVIYSEESAAELREFATRLEQFDGAMRKMRGMPDIALGPSNRLTIYVVPSLSSVQRIQGSGSSNVAGFYIPRAAGSLAIVPRRTGGGGGRFDLNAQTVLLHEYAHHFMMSETAGTAYPAWFVEGFAEFNSTARWEKDGGIGFGLPAMHRAYGLVMLSIPAEKLFTSGANLANDQASEAFYARAWLLTHYLEFEPTRKGQLNAYLNAVNAGKDSLLAARDVFGDLKKLDAELDRYKSRSRLSYRKMRSDQIRIGTIGIRELRPAESALMMLRIQSDRGVTTEQAKALVTRIRKAVAPFASDAFAQATLAEAEYDAENYDLAEAAADRALRANANHIDALLYKGRVLMAKAEAADDRDPKTWRQIRGWFVKANRADAEHAEPLLLFYRTFAAQGSRPTANAIEGLYKAHDLAPQDRGLRMLVAREYLAGGKSEAARVTLTPIAYDPHGGAIGKFAAGLLATIKEKGTKAALEAWDKVGEQEDAAE